MKLTLELTRDEGARLFAAAKISGLDLAAHLRDAVPESEAFVRSLSSQTDLQLQKPDHFYFTASPEQFQNAINELAQMNRDLPVLPDSAFDRENIYEDRL